MNYKILILPVAVIVLGAASCSRDDDPEPAAVAGKGGNATLRITPRHHSRNIDSCKIYIKYNTSDKPASYDDSVWCMQVDGKPVGTITGLKKGNYYLYGYGWDSEILEAVDGGAPYTISNETTLDYNLAVTEDH